MAPKGQTMTHIQHPTHFSGLTCTRPVVGSRCIAPAMQAWTHGLSEHWRHCNGKFILPSVSTKTRYLGRTGSRNAPIRVLLCEWATAQANSQLLHPTQTSERTSNCFTFSLLSFTVNLLLDRFIIAYYSDKFCRVAESSG